MAYTYNPSYSRGKDQDEPRFKVSPRQMQDPISKKTQKTKKQKPITKKACGVLRL
jgi:hypothetical protein